MKAIKGAGARPGFKLTKDRVTHPSPQREAVRGPSEQLPRLLDFSAGDQPSFSALR